MSIIQAASRAPQDACAPYREAAQLEKARKETDSFVEDLAQANEPQNKESGPYNQAKAIAAFIEKNGASLTVADMIAFLDAADKNMQWKECLQKMSVEKNMDLAAYKALLQSAGADKIMLTLDDKRQKAYYPDTKMPNSPGCAEAQAAENDKQLDKDLVDIFGMLVRKNFSQDEENIYEWLPLDECDRVWRRNALALAKTIHKGEITLNGSAISYAELNLAFESNKNFLLEKLGEEKFNALESALKKKSVNATAAPFKITNYGEIVILQN